MAKQNKLTKNLTEKEFDNGYWYANQIKLFAKQIGIANSSKLRKDELEKIIKHFLQTGEVKKSNRKNVVKTGTKDIDIGLKTSLPIKNYTSNKVTKDFILTETYKLKPELKIKSGVWYHLNRWRDEQITKDKNITYGNLVQEFIKLNQADKLEKIAVGRYNNFVANFLAHEKNATRQQAIKEWQKLKTLDVEKDYKSWEQKIK